MLDVLIQGGTVVDGTGAVAGTALHAGMPWGEWETFADYLDVLAGRHYSVDVGVSIGLNSGTICPPVPAASFSDRRATWPRWSPAMSSATTTRTRGYVPAVSSAVGAPADPRHG